MNIRRIWGVTFSPTQTSKKIVNAINSAFPDAEHDSLDLTYPGNIRKKAFDSDDLVVIGVPVYAGRVSPLAVQRLSTIKGNSTPAILVVLYGNREYEDALIELRDLAVAASFIPVAASAFIGEHSFSSPQAPIAPGRPDDSDLALAASFGRKIFQRISQLQDFSKLSSLGVPGNIPYKEGMESPPVTPKVDQAACTLCGMCISTCPGEAITIENNLVMDVEHCIFCCACIKTCPEDAVSIDAPPLLEKKQWLHKNCARRKEPELYF
ncbi:MAG: 4Fe-4S binding protein [Deltaproteobacteria bacterium]|nr:4Fe-4S binding protein [Deltaproteobacteria bacterium]